MAIEDLPEPIQKHILNRVTGRPDKIFHPNRVYITELVKCLRQAYFKRHLSRVPLKAPDCWNFYRGIVFDQDFGYAMRNDPQGREQDRVTLPFFTSVHHTSISISGHLDFYYAADEDRIYELKTTKNDYYIKKTGAKQEHIDQLMFYCFCYGCPHGSVVYVTMEGATVIPIDNLLTKEVINEFILRIKLRAEALVKANLTNQAPVGERLNWEGTWRCKKQYCKYRSLCYPNEMSLMDQIEPLWNTAHPTEEDEVDADTDTTEDSDE